MWSFASSLSAPAITPGNFIIDAATTEIYPLSLHDALPISALRAGSFQGVSPQSLHASSMYSPRGSPRSCSQRSEEHTSNSSHSQISYAVFCLKKKIYIACVVICRRVGSEE